LDGFVVVTTPQQLAMIDAKRSINMIRKLHVNVLGVVENFSGEIFGTGGGEQLAQEMDLNFLGRLEMRTDYRDTSKPTVLNSNTVLNEFQSIVDGMKAGLEAVEVEAD
jgi:ATP-binding protein involved in chromosome partitioning